MTQFGEQGFAPPVDAAHHETALNADTGAQRVAKVYAEALLNAAEKRGQTDEVLEELESLVQDLFRADPEFETFLSSGAVGRDRKAAVLRTVFETRAGELVFNFLMVLNAHERLDLLRPITAKYRELRDQRARRMRVLVRTAVPLPDDQRDHLVRELREAFRMEPVVVARVDPDLLGGMVVRVGDWLYDSSVRTQLESLRNQLIARSSYEIQSRRDRFCSPDGD
jgi:F-type H+-transporting ATPase subunit delta